MTFTYGALPESICNDYGNNRPGPAIKENALNKFTDPLEVCAAAGELGC